MASSHRMVARNGTHETEIKKSRFICHLFRVAAEDEARVHIEAVRKEHWNANHNCTAPIEHTISQPGANGDCKKQSRRLKWQSALELNIG